MLCSPVGFSLSNCAECSFNGEDFLCGNILSLGAVCGDVRALARSCAPPPHVPSDKICYMNVCGYRSTQYICFNTNHQGYTGVQYTNRHKPVVTWFQFWSLEGLDSQISNKNMCPGSAKNEAFHNLTHIRAQDLLDRLAKQDISRTTTLTKSK